MQDSVQNAQLIGATIVAYISLVTFAVPCLLGFKIPSPREYAWRLYAGQTPAKAEGRVSNLNGDRASTASELKSEL